jgi:hypothetical protein
MAAVQVDLFVISVEPEGDQTHVYYGHVEAISGINGRENQNT